MQKNNNNSISLDLYVNLLNTGQLYKGYVENCGYATYEVVPVSTYVNKSDLAYDFYYVCKLNISPDERRKSSNVYYPDSQRDDSWFTPNNVKKATAAITVALVADDVIGVGVVNDVSLPFIWVGGCLFYIVATLYYKKVGLGNKHYPGPWSETQVPKTDFMMQPVTPPTDPENFSNGGKPWFAIGLAYAVYDSHEVIYGDDPTTAMVEKKKERDKQVKSSQKERGRQSCFSPNFYQGGLAPIKVINKFEINRIVNEIYSKTMVITKDNTSVVINHNIEPILRVKK